MTIRALITTTAVVTALLGAIIGGPVGHAAPAGLNATQLTAKMNLVLNRAADRHARIDELADPGTIAGADNIAALKDVWSWAYRLRVVNPVVHGDNLNAQLEITQLIQGAEGTMLRPLTWNNVNNRWKLSKASICAMARQIQTTC